MRILQNFLIFIFEKLLKTLYLLLSKPKYQFIQELFSIERESVLDILEDVLKKEREKDLRISAAQKKELDTRLNSYEKNPENILDWEDVKNEW